MKILSGFLNVRESSIHPVIYFAGDCIFKTELPSNVIRSRLSRYIKRFQERHLPEEKVDQLVSILEKHQAESELTQRDHIRSLKQRHQSKIVCPKCGSQLVVRKVQKERRNERQFLGCERFPNCRYTRNI